MKIYDISQEVFSCEVYPGDPKPEAVALSRMNEGAVCNLSAFSMCAHNGTHIDAPFHFMENGKTVDRIRMEALIGMAYVAEHEGVIGAEDAKDILDKARSAEGECFRRILIRGKAELSEEAAEVFAAEGIFLFGNESQTVGPENAPMAVHKILLGREIVLLEGIRLGNVPEGEYLLCAAPINLAGFDGAPCRAVLVDTEGSFGCGIM